MKDLHSHIIYGIDDGSKSIEESIDLLKCAVNQGMTDIICTPHYMEETEYICNNKEKLDRLNIIKEKIKEENININLYLGNEVYYTNRFLELLNNNEISTLNNSKYLLFEFPLNNQVTHTREVLFELISKGYVPVLAHPERYSFLKKHPDEVLKYIELGVLLQGNYKSFYGGYGRAAKKVFRKYLKNGWYTFIGSDIHHGKDYKLKNLERDFIKFTKNEEYINDLMYNNFDKVINNEDFSIRRF